ncbi:hypothetical protein ACA910_014601 [Epithemia clementina (nom. ined.)]
MSEASKTSASLLSLISSSSSSNANTTTCSTTKSCLHKFSVEEFGDYDFRFDDFGALGVRICGATASYKTKCEDRRVFWASPDDNKRNNHNRKPTTTTASDVEPLLERTTVKTSCEHDNNNSKSIRKTACENGVESSPRLLAFAGVFDGHGGAQAADYCAKGLLGHILSETNGLNTATTNKKSHGQNRHGSVKNDNAYTRQRHKILRALISLRRPWRNSLTTGLLPQSEKYRAAPSFEIQKRSHELRSLEAPYVKAFHCAQKSFQAQKDSPIPLSLLKTRPTSSSSRRSNYSLHKFFRFLCPFCNNSHKNSFSIQGGTTACTLSIYCTVQPQEDSNSTDTNMGGVFAVTANCGDSRLICDDGSGNSNFRQVTRDHRPLDPLELGRLEEYMKKHKKSSTSSGFCYVSKTTGRIYPGGLAVSRSIGDLNFSQAVIATPDVLQWRLDARRGTCRDSEASGDITHRFILATDGLWDIASNDSVGVLAAQHDSQTTDAVSPTTAASRIMIHCLENGGFADDVTITVIDISIQRRR